jgi:hypothetical protein
MPWTGSVFIRDNGAFTGPLVWTDDRDAGTKITSDHHDTHDQDLANGITACINKNGANSPTANINWGGFKVINLGDGSADDDAAAFGQTITAASLNAGTNVLTLTRAAGDVTVDLSALVVGGSTSDFARYSNGANPFQGGATFEGTLGCLYTLQMVDLLTGTGTYTWNLNALTSTNFQITNSAGASFLFSGNSGAATAKVNGATVWTDASLPSSTFTGLLRASDNATITGGWTFTSTSLKLVPFQWSSAVGGGNWNVGPTDASQLVFTDPGGLSPLIYQLDAAPKAGAYLQIGPNAKRAWDQGSLQSGLTAAPTGGEDGNLAVVQSGADKGFWTRISGSWVKLIAFP